MALSDAHVLREGASIGMEQLTLQIPKMWADHHVLAVRKVLSGIDGVREVEASAARKRVSLRYDPSVVGRDQVVQALQSAGYDSTEAQFPEPPANKEPGSSWFASDLRVTQTNRADLEMSGDFRKY